MISGRNVTPVAECKGTGQNAWGGKKEDCLGAIPGTSQEAEEDSWGGECFKHDKIVPFQIERIVKEKNSHLSAAELVKKLEGKEIIIFSVFFWLCYRALSQLMEWNTTFSERFSSFRSGRENAEQVTISHFNFVNEDNWSEIIMKSIFQLNWRKKSRKSERMRQREWNWRARTMEWTSRWTLESSLCSVGILTVNSESSSWFSDGSGRIDLPCVLPLHLQPLGTLCSASASPPSRSLHSPRLQSQAPIRQHLHCQPFYCESSFSRVFSAIF